MTPAEYENLMGLLRDINRNLVKFGELMESMFRPAVIMVPEDELWKHRVTQQ